MAEYPEHDKLKAHSDEAHTLSALWDWMQSEGIVLAKWGQTAERPIPCTCATGPLHFHGLAIDALTERQQAVLLKLRGEELADYRRHLPVCEVCNGSGRDWETYEIAGELEHLHLTPEQFIGRFLGIDPEKLSDEKDQMLADIRAANAERSVA